MRILVPVDLGEDSAALVRHAAAFCAGGDNDLIILHVYSDDAATEAVRNEGLFIDVYVGRLRSELNYLRAQAGACGQKARVEVVRGDPADTIMTRAKELGADLIVMATHRRTGLSRLLMGSVAEGVLRRAPCPVVLIPVNILAGRSQDAAAVGILRGGRLP